MLPTSSSLIPNIHYLPAVSIDRDLNVSILEVGQRLLKACARYQGVSTFVVSLLAANKRGLDNWTTLDSSNKRVQLEYSVWRVYGKLEIFTRKSIFLPIVFSK